MIGRGLIIAVSLGFTLLACDRETAKNPDVSRNAPSQHDQSSSAPSPQERDNGPKMNPIVPTNASQVGAAPQQVQVELQEYEIRMPQTFPAGPISLMVVNSGKENHGLVIEGNGARFGTQEPLTRGGSTTVAVDLKPGTYNVYCPVDGHKGKGMARTISVQ